MKRHKQVTISKAERIRNRIRILLFLYLLALVKITLFKLKLNYIFTPFVPVFDKACINLNLKKANFIPFRTIAYFLQGGEPFYFWFPNVVGNMVLFIPCGLLLPALYPGYLRYWRFIFVIILMSLSIELMQFFTCLGELDVDDIMLNLAGALAGLGTYKAFTRK